MPLVRSVQQASSRLSLNKIAAMIALSVGWPMLQVYLLAQPVRQEPIQMLIVALVSTVPDIYTHQLNLANATHVGSVLSPTTQSTV